MPHFTLIAGPNGAGKSSFSKVLSPSNCIVFDADEVKAQKEKQFPDLHIDSVESLVTSEYWEIERSAVKNGKSLTVETNLRNDFLIERSGHIKSMGYVTNFIFMLLPDVETSLDRVNLRVKQKGHFVDLDSIKYNFEHSLLNFKKHFYKFDNLLLFDCSPGATVSQPVTILIVNNNKLSFIDTKAPLWAKSIINEIVQRLTDSNIK